MSASERFERKMKYLKIEGFTGFNLIDAIRPELKELAKHYKLDIPAMAKYFNVELNQLKKVLRKEPLFLKDTAGIVWGD